MLSVSNFSTLVSKMHSFHPSKSQRENSWSNFSCIRRNRIWLAWNIDADKMFTLNDKLYSFHKIYKSLCRLGIPLCPYFSFGGKIDKQLNDCLNSWILFFFSWALQESRVKAQEFHCERWRWRYLCFDTYSESVCSIFIAHFNSQHRFVSLALYESL